MNTVDTSMSWPKRREPRHKLRMTDSNMGGLSWRRQTRTCFVGFIISDVTLSLSLCVSSLVCCERFNFLVDYFSTTFG